MRAYYVINNSGNFSKSETIHLPLGLNLAEMIIYVQGYMFQSGWSSKTPHTIYINKGNGYKFVSGCEDSWVKDYDSIMTDVDNIFSR
tara:strand:- start:24 stop:284 length:261 start_codon:yes stop_codon:yes gene_type:complete